MTLDDVVDEFRRHLWLPDLGVLYVTLGTVVANRLPGDPVWLLDIGSSSMGKSEVLGALRNLPEFHAVSTFSEAGLVSAAPDGTPGLLKEMGEFGLLVFSDLTTILSKHKPDHEGALGCLREVYDGHYVRRAGHRGGPAEWEGKVGLIAGVTEAIDDFEFGQLGERFVRYRLPALTAADVEETTSLIMEDVHGRPLHRKGLADTVAKLMGSLDLPEHPPALAPMESLRLSTLVGLGTQCRSPVVRDTYKGDDIRRVPVPEGPGRMLTQLAQLVAGMRVVGVPDDEVWRLAAKVALDGMHPMRRQVLGVLVDADRRLTTATVAGKCALPQTSVRRHLQDLAAHGVLTMTWESPETWGVSNRTMGQWWALEGGCE